VNEKANWRGRQLGERAVASLKPHPRNPRTHSKKQISQIADSIRRFGFLNPVLVDGRNRIVAGHGRVEAARLLGMEEVPAIEVDGLSEADCRAYIIADNRLAELAGWDEDLLKLELGSILEIDESYDLEVTGFAGGELEALLAAVEAGQVPAEAPPPEVDEEGEPVSYPGVIWQLGRHRLICADARDPGTYARLMGEERAQLVFTDPPYNVPVSGHICGLGKVQHAEFAMASGEMTREQFCEFLRSVLGNLAAFSSDGSIHFVCMDWRHMGEVLEAGEAVYAELKNLIVWNKSNGGMGTFYRSKHELVFAFKHGSAAHINNFGLGENGRYRTNVWDYAGINSFRSGRDAELAMHPTVKPVAMVADAIRDCSKRGGIVLDAFSGSGTTIMAAEETGRCARAIEIDPRYVDVAVQRWQKATGTSAVIAGTDTTFDACRQLFV
jgi:DNA modification methylase